jgi:hypothetical protein
MTLVAPRPADAPPVDAEALFKEARRRRRQRRMAWLLAVVLVATTAAVVSVWQASPTKTTPRQGAPTPRPPVPVAMPNSIVGWTPTSNVVVLSTATGQILRTLASNISVIAPGLPSLSVAPDGTVYFESAEPAPYNRQLGSGDQILTVPITGGQVRDIAAGSDPQVSPNGRFLAFISPDPAGQAGEAPYLVPPVGIDIATLDPGGTIASARTLWPGPAQLNQGASDLAWSSDSSHLSFDLLNPTTTVTTSWTISTSAALTSLASARRIPLHHVGLTWNGYWGANRNGAPVGLGVLTSTSGSQAVVTIDPATGRIVSRLFGIPAAICTARPEAANAGCSSDFSNEVIGDSAGTSVLVAGAIPLVDDSPTASGQTFLYRWSVGDRSATRVAKQILVASWGS